MSPVRDTNLDLSPAATDLPLIVTNVLSANTLDLEGTPLTGLCVRLNVDFTLGATVASALDDTLNVIIHAASSTPVASSDPIVGELDVPITFADATAAQSFERIIPFTTSYRYVRAEFALTGTATDSPSWSVVDAFVTLNAGLVWDRNVNFH